MKKDIPLLKSQLINMRLSPDVFNMAKQLTKRAGKPVTTILADLLAEDLRRIWNLAAKA